MGRKNDYWFRQSSDNEEYPVNWRGWVCWLTMILALGLLCFGPYLIVERSLLWFRVLCLLVLAVCFLIMNRKSDRIDSEIEIESKPPSARNLPDSNSDKTP